MMLLNYGKEVKHYKFKFYYLNLSREQLYFMYSAILNF
jgi:hypothetical protein